MQWLQERLELKDKHTWFALRPKPMRKLSGLMSRWRKPLECIYSTRLICHRINASITPIETTVLQHSTIVRKNEGEKTSMHLLTDQQAWELFSMWIFYCSSWISLPSSAQANQLPLHCTRPPLQTTLSEGFQLN